MDTVQLLQAQLQQLSDIEHLLLYGLLSISALMGFSRGASM